MWVADVYNYDKEINCKLWRRFMKRELGIARCGLACCLCSENVECSGCGSNGCPDNDFVKIKNVRLRKN